MLKETTNLWRRKHTRQNHGNANETGHVIRLAAKLLDPSELTGEFHPDSQFFFALMDLKKCLHKGCGYQ